MLSTAAFNALLKTLEEPPEHVKFFFATTEAHKVLPTIVSRCQRFEFRPISDAVIVEKLMQICQTEDIKVEAPALVSIARLANGGMRDAQFTPAYPGPHKKAVGLPGGRSAPKIPPKSESLW